MEIIVELHLAGNCVLLSHYKPFSFLFFWEHSGLLKQLRKMLLCEIVYSIQYFCVAGFDSSSILWSLFPVLPRCYAATPNPLLLMCFVCITCYAAMCKATVCQWTVSSFSVSVSNERHEWCSESTGKVSRSGDCDTGQGALERLQNCGLPLADTHTVNLEPLCLIYCTRTLCYLAALHTFALWHAHRNTLVGASSNASMQIWGWVTCTSTVCILLFI